MTAYQNVIITPTYNKHFKYIAKYLESFDKWLEDKELPFYFIISKPELDEFNQLIKPYKDSLNINILFIEDLFKKYGVDKNPDEILKIYGRYSFQTLKKFYACLEVPAKHALILDSESMLIKPTNMTKLFDDFFENPRFFVSKNSMRPPEFFISKAYEWTEQTAAFFQADPDYWVIEGFEWFYDIKILKDLFKDHGMPYDIVKNMQKLNERRNATTVDIIRMLNTCYEMPKVLIENLPETTNNRVDVLEALLYYQYLIKHHKKYGYNMLITQEEMQKVLGQEKYECFINKFNASGWKYTGVLENFMSFVNEDNEKEFGEFIKRHKISVMRSNEKEKSVPSQKYVTDFECVKILAASQDHKLGINFNHKTYWTHKAGIVENLNKLKKYAKRFFLKPVPETIKWLCAPIEILRELLICGIKSIKYLTKNK